jgi:murein DD-endopeptidase MepM/ murein hydrolase activator NlpD
MFKPNKGLAILIPLSFLIFFTAAQSLDFDISSVFQKVSPAETTTDKASVSATPGKKPAPLVFGIPTDSFEIVEGRVARGESLSDILIAYNISPATIHHLEKKAKAVFNVKRIHAKRNYMVLHARDSAQTAQFFIYEPNDIEYIVYDLRGDLQVTRTSREIDTIERELAGEIHGSLYESMLEAGGTAQLVDMFADIYGWRLNLNHIQPGDKFKLIFEEKQINGKAIGYGQLKGAFFEHRGEQLYGIGFDQGHGTSYYDQDGKSLKKAFLKEPLEYSRISSRFSKNRFHPVQKRYKAHLGTDFAAPRGTPIRSVGEGVVVESAYSRGNGYYVKIKHNRKYATQYLHMSKFAKGMRRGAQVKQGQTIGYVGSTGLATGPHLCFRFWENGRQVDILKVKLPAADPVKRKNMATFSAAKEAMIKRLEALDVNTASQQLVASEKAAIASGKRDS